MVPLVEPREREAMQIRNVRFEMCLRHTHTHTHTPISFFRYAGITDKKDPVDNVPDYSRTCKIEVRTRKKK